MNVFDRMKARWGVGFLGHGRHPAGLFPGRSHHGPAPGPIVAVILPEAAPGWLQWVVYLVVMMPVYQALLLGYGTLLGQFDFFWSKLKLIGRLVSGRAAGASG